MEEFVFGNEEKLPTLTRMQEHFTGCRVLASCLMSNQVHLLLEPPLPAVAASMVPDPLSLDRADAVAFHQALDLTRQQGAFEDVNFVEITLEEKPFAAGRLAEVAA